MKIGFISDCELSDKRSWSGTIYFLNNTLKNDYEIYPIVINNRFHKFLRKIIKVLSFKKCNYTTLDSILYNKSVNKKVKKAIEEGVEVFFAPAASTLLGNSNIPDYCKVIYLSDATYHLMVDYYFFGVGKESRKRLNELEFNSLIRANSVVFSSDWAKNDAISYYGIDANKIHVLPFGANLKDNYSPKKYEKNKKNYKVLFVGVEWERKGADIAIECVNELNRLQKMMHFELNIIGLEKPKDREFEDDIHFIGRLNKNNTDEFEKMIEYYRESDIFLLPTKAECSAIVFSEAAMYGLPIFTHNTGGVMSYVDEGRTGRGLELGATGKDFAFAILQMLNEGKYPEWSLNARKKYENELNWDKWYSDFKKIIESSGSNFEE